MWLNTGLHIFQFTVCRKTGKPHWIPTEFYITGTDEYSKCLTKNLNKFSGIKTCNIPMVRYFTYIGKFWVRTEWMIPEYFSKAGTMWHERRIILKGRKSPCSPGGKGSNTCFLSWHPPPPWKTKRYSTQKSCMQVSQWLRNCTIDKTIHSSLMQSTFQVPYIFSLIIHRTRLREIN